MAGWCVSPYQKSAPLIAPDGTLARVALGMGWPEVVRAVRRVG